MQPEIEPDRPAAMAASEAGSAAEPTKPADAASTEPLAAPPTPHRRGWLWRVWPVLTLMVLLTGIGWLAWNYELASDWLVLRGYRAPSDIRQLADDTAMTAYGRRLFYVNKPRVEGREAFNASCSNVHDEVSVLGCYTGDRRGIFIYNVTEEELDGIKQVTAAHEMLHQAYDRLGRDERRRIDDLLDAYAKTVTNPELLSKLDTYRETEPKELKNEYHSIFGTEVRELPGELEEHYALYFARRGQVVDLYERYQGAFTARTQKIAAYDDRLDDLKGQIDAGKADLKRREAALTTRRAEMDAYLANDDIPAYNAAVPEFNQQVAAYKATVAEVNAVIRQHNQLIEERNAIAIEEQQLQRAIDSHAASASEQ